MRSIRPRLSSPTHARLAALPGVALALALAACGGDSSSEPQGPPQVARLTLAAPLDSTREFEDRQVLVSAFDRSGQPITAPTLTWQSSDTTVVSVNAAGLATGRQPGSATLTVRGGSASATVTMKVLPVPVYDILLRFQGGLSADTLLVGSSATVVADPRDIGGRPLLGRQVALSLSDTTRATLDASGKVTARLPGPLTFVARVDTVERRQSLLVRPAYAAQLTVRMADPRKLRDTLWVGLRDSLIVAFADADGKALSSDFRSVAFKSDDEKVAAVGVGGAVIPVGPGTTTIRASGDRLTASRQVLVVTAPVLNVFGSPDTVRVLPGDATQILPTLVDGAGLRVANLTGHTLRYESLAPSIASVDASGNVVGKAQGRTQVRITSDRGTALVPVRVVAPAGDRAFKITLRFVGPTPAPYVVEAFTTAAKRWEGIIRESTGSEEIDIPRSCGADSVRTETVSDVVIYARIDSIDGPSNILGSAGPCIVKTMPTGRWLPTVGRMTFDSADMNLMQTTGRLMNVITHEMGHVLGVGTMWAARYNLGTALALQSGRDPRYFGRGGIGAAAGMGFTGFSVPDLGTPVLDNVPLEDTGGSGTAGAHWRRSVFGNELMNGFAGAGAQPLSLLTVLAMADLGYVVTTNAAETWGKVLLGTPSTSSAVLRPYLGASGDAIRLNEQLTGPEYVVDRRGRRTRLSVAGQ